MSCWMFFSTLFIVKNGFCSDGFCIDFVSSTPWAKGTFLCFTISYSMMGLFGWIPLVGIGFVVPMWIGLYIFLIWMFASMTAFHVQSADKRVRTSWRWRSAFIGNTWLNLSADLFLDVCSFHGIQVLCDCGVCIDMCTYIGPNASYRNVICRSDRAWLSTSSTDMSALIST